MVKAHYAAHCTSTMFYERKVTLVRLDHSSLVSSNVMTPMISDRRPLVDYWVLNLVFIVILNSYLNRIYRTSAMDI